MAKRLRKFCDLETENRAKRSKLHIDLLSDVDEIEEVEDGGALGHAHRKQTEQQQQQQHQHKSRSKHKQHQKQQLTIEDNGRHDFNTSPYHRHMKANSHQAERRPSRIVVPLTIDDSDSDDTVAPKDTTTTTTVAVDLWSPFVEHCEQIVLDASASKSCVLHEFTSNHHEQDNNRYAYNIDIDIDQDEHGNDNDNDNDNAHNINKDNDSDKHKDNGHYINDAQASVGDQISGESVAVDSILDMCDPCLNTTTTTTSPPPSETSPTLSLDLFPSDIEHDSAEDLLDFQQKSIINNNNRLQQSKTLTQGLSRSKRSQLSRLQTRITWIGDPIRVEDDKVYYQGFIKCNIEYKINDTAMLVNSDNDGTYHSLLIRFKSRRYEMLNHCGCFCACNRLDCTDL